MSQHIFTGTAAPATTPTAVGQHYIDTTNDISYISVGTSSSADWHVATVQNALIEELTGHIEIGQDKDYVLTQAASYGFTINTLTIDASNGTGSAALKIDGVAVTNISAVSVSTVEASANASGANTVAVGQTVVLTLSSTDVLRDVSFSVKITRS